MDFYEGYNLFPNENSCCDGSHKPANWGSKLKKTFWKRCNVQWSTIDKILGPGTLNYLEQERGRPTSFVDCIMYYIVWPVERLFVIMLAWRWNWLLAQHDNLSLTLIFYVCPIVRCSWLWEDGLWHDASIISSSDFSFGATSNWSLLSLMHLCKRFFNGSLFQMLAVWKALMWWRTNYHMDDRFK